MDFNKSEQYVIVSVLIAIMEADGIIHPNETSYLNKILQVFSTSESEIEEITPYDPVTTPIILKVMSENKKEEAREIFIGMAKCDGYADPREIKIIDSIF